jgi:hypothetical protein
LSKGNAKREEREGNAGARADFQEGYGRMVKMLILIDLERTEMPFGWEGACSS